MNKTAQTVSYSVPTLEERSVFALVQIAEALHLIWLTMVGIGCIWVIKSFIGGFLM